MKVDLVVTGDRPVKGAKDGETVTVSGSEARTFVGMGLAKYADPNTPKVMAERKAEKRAAAVAAEAPATETPKPARRAPAKTAAAKTAPKAAAKKPAARKTASGEKPAARKRGYQTRDMKAGE